MRPMVPRRKGNFGSASGAGSRFGVRLLAM
jgi:hypothetical protein